MAQRLTTVRETLGYKERKAFATKLEINPETLGGYERGDSKPDNFYLFTLKRDYSVNLDWVLTGEGEMFDRVKIKRVTDPEGRTIGKPPEIIELPVYGDVRASAGPGLATTSEEITDAVYFTTGFLRSHGAVPEQCVIIWASGDSMAPTIPDGSILIVDQSQHDIRNGHIMVIRVDDDILVKRIQRRPNGQIDLISDNPIYSPDVFDTAALTDLQVIGRVIYFCRTP